jgi:hypothetical protein
MWRMRAAGEEPRTSWEEAWSGGWWWKVRKSCTGEEGVPEKSCEAEEEPAKSCGEAPEKSCGEVRKTGGKSWWWEEVVALRWTKGGKSSLWEEVVLRWTKEDKSSW